MKASEQLIEKLKEFEGLRRVAYRCPAGVWTIGYGHTAGVRRGMTIDEREADGLLREDLKMVEAAVNGLGVCAKQCEFDALVSFAFNLGVHALKGSTLLKCIERGDGKRDIQRQFRRWVYSDGKVLAGLVKRREWEARRFCDEEV